MQSLIAEQPLMMALLLAALAAAILFGWLQSGNRAMLAAGLVTVLLIPLSWYISVQWVTDREQIRAAIERTVEAVNDNDIERAIEVIEPRRRELIAAARADLARFHFSEARLTQVRSIELVQGSEPPEAEVDLTARVVVSDRGGSMTDVTVARRVILHFRQANDGNWYVHDYNHLPIIGPADNYSPRR